MVVSLLDATIFVPGFLTILMLNRRTLRIKAMQTIFAYRQSREANLGLAKMYIDKNFSPDLNSMEYQDKSLLDQQKTEANDLFDTLLEENLNNGLANDDKVKDVVKEAIANYHTNNKRDFNYFKKHMVSEAEKISDLYLSILQLLIDFIYLAEEDTRRDHSNFVKNLLIRALESDEALETVILRRNISWKNHKSEVRQWFKDFIKKDEAYIKYQNLTSPGFNNDKEIVMHLLKNYVFKNDAIDKFFEQDDLNWDEDRAIVKSLSTKTIKSMEQGDDNTVDLQDLSYNWEDDKAFFKLLFEETIRVEDEYEEIISRKTKNWDIERIATTDRIILEMAISEMINFPSIPVKVTINEYIEVAKRYSTPKSKVFVNGVLDVIADELVANGKIRKSGRGLIDNK